jgi:hypothetical protein
MAIQTLPTTSETREMLSLNVAFPVPGTYLPADHGYLHYRAITRAVPAAVQYCSGSTPCGINGILTLPKRQYCHWDAVLNALRHQCKIQW